MVALDEPLLPTGGMSSSDPNAPPDQTKTGPVLDDAVLNQIRSVLIKAGVTATMIDLPMDSAMGSTKSLISRETSIDSWGDDVDIEEGPAKQKKGGFFRRRLSALAQKRQQRLIHASTSEYKIAKDIYNMFFLSKNWSLPFWYTLLTVCNKLTLYGIVLWWIYCPGGWRDSQNKDENFPNGPLPIVQATQLLLIPVAIGITEELLITMDVLSKTGWAQIKDQPQATEHKFWIANVLRALDGLTWLIIITSLMLMANDVLSMFLNFAALQFLQCIDNAAYEMAEQGRLTCEFELLARKVDTTTLPTKRNSWREYLDTIILFALLSLLYIVWGLVNFVDKGRFESP